MSWFPETMKREGPVEVDEGVLLERRDVLKVSVGALALLSLGGPQRAIAQEASVSDDAELSWDQLVKEAVPLAEKLVAAKKPNEEAYLGRLAALVHRLRIPADDDFEFRAKRPISVLQFRLQPGKGFEWHDHRDYNGVLLCVAGDARVKSADVVGDDARPKGTFLIRQTVDARLSRGRVASLARLRDNIHDVRGAGDKGARLLDFFTFFDSGGRSVYLQVEEKAKDPGKGLFEASWK